MGALGNNIRALREHHGLSQQAFAEIAGVSRGAVAKWESGETTFIRPANLKAVLSHFHITEDELLSDAMGIASQKESVENAEHVSKRASYLPFVSFFDTNDVRSEEQRIEVPVSVASRHAHAFATSVEQPDVDRQIPVGSVVVIDPDLETTQGSLALVDYQGSHLVRRVFLGQSGVMLSPDSVQECNDIFAPRDEVTIVGPVVWWQARECLR